MDMGLSAASVAISRSGASSLAEFAAMRTPAILVPYPIAADNHQFHNARIFSEAGAAAIMQQREITTDKLTEVVLDLFQNSEKRARMSEALTKWHKPECADQIARKILGEASPGYSIPQTTFISALTA
jgi:UDP-N-acetylglucosamine--N-acetylmuramyl-(pentapeptide) pyrophosphoryl-undecaprenol N-acetylglucosamine transferase